MYFKGYFDQISIIVSDHVWKLRGLRLSWVRKRKIIVNFRPITCLENAILFCVFFNNDLHKNQKSDIFKSFRKFTLYIVLL